jgi:hypothetical protein
LTPAAPSSGKTIAVSIPAGTLEAGEQTLLAFLGPPERRDSVLWPLVAVTRASDEDLTAIESWIDVEAPAAALQSFEARLAVVKPALFRGLASPHAGLRSMALYELNRWCEFDDPIYSVADVKIVEGLAASTKREDAQRALKLLDLAERMRARARR